MALISCIECQAVVSDKADKCGQCGCPVSVSVEQADKSGGGGVRTLIQINLPPNALMLGYVTVLNSKTNEKLGTPSVGDTMMLSITEPITIKAKGFKGEETVKPGMKYQMNGKQGMFSCQMWLTELGKA